MTGVTDPLVNGGQRKSSFQSKVSFQFFGLESRRIDMEFELNDPLILHYRSLTLLSFEKFTSLTSDVLLYRTLVGLSGR